MLLNQHEIQLQLQKEITSQQTTVDYQDGSRLMVRVKQEENMLLPIINDPETVLNFAKMAANSYKQRSIDGWRNMTSNYTELDGFGWERNGLRGHIYSNAAEDLVVIGFKGTSTLLMGGGTVSMDKYTDNIMFSCCCARVDISWMPVCGCYLGGLKETASKSDYGNYPSSGRCNQTCLAQVIKEDADSYVNQAINIVKKVQENYPKAQLWFTGHSLGGAIASLMAVTFDTTAAVTFEAPGDRLYAERLGILANQRGPYWAFPIWNFGITTDPVYMGTCQGLSTSCYISGYAMEAKCRHGRDCVIEIEGREGVFDVNTHRIDWVIDNVLQGSYQMPQCKPNIGCRDCAGWSFET